MKAGIAAKPKRMFLTTMASLLSNRYVSTLYYAAPTLTRWHRTRVPLQNCEFVLVPGPHDLTAGSVHTLPRPPLLGIVTQVR